MNISKSLTPEAREREAQAKFMEEAIQKVEKYFGRMCSEMGSVTRKTARLRDKYDLLAKTFHEYGTVEQGPLRTQLSSFAEQLSSIQDYRQAEIERLQVKVVDPLTMYGAECKHTQNEVNKSFKTRRQELKQQQRVLNMQAKAPNDRHAISLAEAELQKRALDVARSTRGLEEIVDKFEVKKIKDLKNILMEFVKIEMLFHAKALEVYTAAFKNLEMIDEEEHIEVFPHHDRAVYQSWWPSMTKDMQTDHEAFRNALRPSTNMQERMDIAKNVHFSFNDSTSSDPQSRSFQQSAAQARERHRRRREDETLHADDLQAGEEWESEEDTDDDYDDDDVSNYVDSRGDRIGRR